jgi:hypothetical protein
MMRGAKLDRLIVGSLMKETKHKKLEAAGWSVGSVDQFLSLTPEEAAVVELKLRVDENAKGSKVIPEDHR